VTADRDLEAVAAALFRHRYGRDEVPESFDQSRMSDCRQDAAALLPLIREREAAAWERGFVAGADSQKSWSSDTPGYALAANPYTESEGTR
jgi:hypothetical protein